LGARRGDSGLTLIEMLAVLALIGIMSGLALAVWRPDAPGRRLSAEAQGLAARLALAADEALVTGRPLALRWQSGGYDIVQWDPVTGWQAARLPGLATAHRLAAGIVIGQADGLLIVSPQGDGPPLDLALQAGSKRAVVRFDGLTARVAPAGEEQVGDAT